MAYSEPIRRSDDTMEVDEPSQPIRTTPRAPRNRKPRGDRSTGPPTPATGLSNQPAYSAGERQTSSTKGKARALNKEILEQEKEERGQQLNELLRRLDRVDVDPALADFMEEDEVAQIVVRQLLNTIDNLQEELEKEKRARRDADTRLIRATHKRPNPQSSRIDDGEGQRQIKRLRSNEEGRNTAPSIAGSSALPDQPLLGTGPVEPISQPQSTTDDAPNPMTGDDVSQSDRTRRKMRRGEGETPAPTSYDLPGPVTVTPAPACDPAPEETHQLKFIDDDPTRYDDDGLWEAIEGETKSQIADRKSHNLQIMKKRRRIDNQRREEDDRQRAYNESRPGRVPDGIGVVTVGQNPERDNSFPGLISRWFYRSPMTNTVYASQTAVDAAHYEMETGKPYQSQDDRRLYAVVSRGFPMNPREVRKLAQLVMDTHRSDADRIEGFRLHAELRRISRLSAPERRDRAMTEILDDRNLPPRFGAPFPPEHPRWDHKPIPRRPSTWSGAGLRTPDPSAAFDLELWAKYIQYHGRPGSSNPFVGLAFNYALHVNYRSVFGYLLCRALAPASTIARSVFSRHFACIVAVPRRYRDLVQEWSRTSGQQPDFPNPGLTVTLTRMDWTNHDAHAMTVDDVANTLISNCIPISWVDHAYTFGLHFLNHQLDGSPESRDMYEAVDDLRIVNLSVWGIPPAISEWDGWRIPSVEDVERIQQIMIGEERRGIYCLDDSTDWLRVGEDPHMEQLRTRRNLADPRVRRSPSPPLAGPSNPPTSSDDIIMANVEEGPAKDGGVTTATEGDDLVG
jgi:hypothetical protein